MNQEKTMNFIIRIEEAAITTLSIYFLTLHNLNLPIWVLVLLFFSPDISILAYLVNKRVGAIIYNLFHHRGLALTLLAIGFLTNLDVMITCSLILVAHSSFDRMLGYGLKFADNFKHTSLGWMGKDK